VGVRNIGKTGGRAWAIAALLAGAAALAYADVHVIRVARNAPVAAAFGLTTAQAGRDLIVQWDPTAASLAGAYSADLYIDDGSHPTQLLLLKGQISGAAIQYSPFTTNVGVRLVAHFPDGRVAQESIRMVSNGVARSRYPGSVTIRVGS